MTFPVKYEVWRSHPDGEDMRISQYGLELAGARKELAECLAGKAEFYPNSPIGFYLVKVSRERLQE